MVKIRTSSKIIVRKIDYLGSDEDISAAAKVLEPEAYREFLRTHPKGSGHTDGLIRYLMKNRHGTPFEHNCFRFFAKGPILMWREWHRHRIGFSYNEQSGRYTQLEPEFYIPPRDRPMIKVEDWKPGKPKFLQCDNDEVYEKLVNNLLDAYQEAYDGYEKNLEMGIDPGLARDGLGVGLFSSCWVTCNARSIMHFLGLRTHEEEANHPAYPLYEMEIAARQVEADFLSAFPLTYKAFCDFGREAP